MQTSISCARSAVRNVISTPYTDPALQTMFHLCYFKLLETDIGCTLAYLQARQSVDKYIHDIQYVFLLSLADENSTLAELLGNIHSPIFQHIKTYLAFH